MMLEEAGKRDRVWPDEGQITQQLYGLCHSELPSVLLNRNGEVKVKVKIVK